MMHIQMLTLAVVLLACLSSVGALQMRTRSPAFFRTPTRAALPGFVIAPVLTRQCNMVLCATPEERSGSETVDALGLLGVEMAEGEEGAETEAGAEVVEAEAEEEGKIMVFGLNLKDPQDWITIVLSGVVAYNTVDIVGYYALKLFQKA